MTAATYLSPQTAAAVIGSPSTTTTVTLNLLRSSYRAPVFGQMVAFETTITDPATGITHDEVALGTVTAIETVNPAHAPRAVEAQHVAAKGRIQGSGDEGDTRGVTVGIEAVFRRHEGTSSLLGDRVWQPAGSTLSNSPATGNAVALLTQERVDELMQGVPDQRWLGRLHGSQVTVPYVQGHFAGPRGSRHDVIAGTTGSGKTAATALMMACDLFHDSFGQIIVDPQGQWATEHGMPFSLQGLATALGRKVTVARLSRSLRLRKDAPMFTELLARTGLFTELAFGAGSDAQIANACRVFEDALDDRKALDKHTGTDDWTEADPALLLRYLLTELRDVLPTGTVYAGKDGQQRVRYAIARPTEEELADEGADAPVGRFRDGVLDQEPDNHGEAGGKRWANVVARFAPILNLWSPFSPDGARRLAAGEDPAGFDRSQLRRKAWPLMMDVFTRDESRPAPWLILDLSGDELLPVDAGAEAEGDAVDAAEAARLVLDNAGVKARIMRQLVGDLLRSGTSAFKAGEPLNVRVTFDEAWQYALQPDATTDRAIAALSDQLEDGARDARKIGVGFRFILQAPSGLREGIWKQCTGRVIGYGVSEQSDLKRLANVVGDEHLRLYLSLTGPEATGQYPFMVAGAGVTGLSFGSKPVFVDMFNDPSEWLRSNAGWVSDARRRWLQHLPGGDSGGSLTEMPPRPAQDAAVEAHVAAKALRSGAANQAAAKRLTAAKGTAAKGGFGMTPKTAVAPDDSYTDQLAQGADPAPF
ncbi:MAG: hypothetical protein L0H93_07530 [Nocardioides sp.]|nr:hypothetical protein [Nocardioides sp.]